ncbi:MAG TPA: malate dehydrogenase, partial [Flavobacteriaceae bacterium]|nr:malate dehydrogenase [Flavobacteriaceae bacterium]
NAGIVDSVTENLLKHSPNAIIVVVSNPMDTMTYLVLKKTGLPRNRVIGMGGVLDSSRFKTYISLALNNEPQKNINAMVIGGHGDTTMIPLIDHAKVNNKPLSELLSVGEISNIASDTMVGGATLTKLLGTSAWYAPGASVAYLVKSILNNSKEMLPCSVMLNGEYGYDDLCIGVPCIIGTNGLEEIIEVNLNEIDKERFQKSVEAVKSTNLTLKGLI